MRFLSVGFNPHALRKEERKIAPKGRIMVMNVNRKRAMAAGILHLPSLIMTDLLLIDVILVYLFLLNNT